MSDSFSSSLQTKFPHKKSWQEQSPCQLYSPTHYNPRFATHHSSLIGHREFYIVHSSSFILHLRCNQRRCNQRIIPYLASPEFGSTIKLDSSTASKSEPFT